MRKNIHIDEKTDNKIEKIKSYNGFKSRSEVVCNAINFYDDYLNNKEAGEYLCRELEAIIKINLNLLENNLENKIKNIISKGINQKQNKNKF